MLCLCLCNVNLLFELRKWNNVLLMMVGGGVCQVCQVWMLFFWEQVTFRLFDILT